MMIKTHCLVTGGGGFLGSHIVDELINLGWEVVVIDDLSGGAERNINRKALFYRGSILDVKFLKKIFGKFKFDYVYHIAAYAAEGLSHFIRKFNYENNVVGSINVINECVLHNVKHIAFTSSIAVYGSGVPPFIEESPINPEDPYGIAKLTVEKDLEAAHKMFGLNHTVFRPHNCYGSRQNIADKYRNVIGIFMNQLMQGKEMTIFGDGLQTRAFTHVSSVVPIIATAPLIPGAMNQIFNLGTDKQYTVLELANEVAKCFNVNPKIKFLEQRKEVVHAYSDHSKLRQVFNLKDVSLRDGLMEMTEWAKKVGPRKAKKFKNIEVEKNLPESWK